MTAVALHKGNVYWELSGWAPKYFPAQLKVDIRARLKDKIMFGSDYPSMPYERIFREWDELGYKDDVMEAHLPRQRRARARTLTPAAQSCASSCSAARPALFVTELAAELGPQAAELGPGLERLAREGAIVISEHGAPDPHLDGADLRIVAPVGAQAPRAEAEATAVDAAERLWMVWLGSFLASHRCS